MSRKLSQNCGNCSKPCNTGCARCGFRYCSFDCQKIDWPVHRKECLSFIFQQKRITLSTPLSTKQERKDNTSFEQNTEHENCSKHNITEDQDQLKVVPSPKDKSLPKTLSPTPISVPKKPYIQIEKLQIYDDKPNQTEIEKTSTKIAITSFIRSNCVYIRDADEETTSRYNMVHKVVQQLSKNLHPIKSLPEEGTFLIVNANGFKRCTVQSVKDITRIKVFLSDFGQQEVVQLSQLYEPGNRLEKLASTSFIKMLKLENVPEFYLNHKAAEYVKLLLTDQVYLELHQESQDQGKIFDVISNEFINDVLFCYSQEETEEMEQLDEYEPEGKKEYTFVQESIMKIQDIPKKELPIKTEVSLMIYDTSQLEQNYIISCVNIDDLGEIKEAIRDIHDYGMKNQNKTYKPEKDDICIGFYAKRKKWCRAEFIDFTDQNQSKGTLCFIDYGKICEVPIQNILKFPEALNYIPNYLYTCRVYGLPKIPTEELMERLKELLPENGVAKAKSLSAVDTNYHLIEMEAILKILVSEDFI